MNNNRGLFIVFEGIDGSGKTTQVKMLSAALEAMGRKTFITAEPTTFPTGKALREALSGRVKKSECEMAVMFVQDRIAHNITAEEGIEALLEAGVDVICDRYYYSSLAYQGQATDYQWVKTMNIDCPEIRRPDACIYIDLLPEQSLERISKGRDSVEIYENVETLTKVRNQFLAVIKDLEATDNIHVVNGYRTPDEVSSDICKIVKEMI